MKRTILLLYIFFLLVFIQKNTYPDTIYNNSGKALELNLYILESERSEGRYVESDLIDSGFVKYNYEYLSKNKDIDERMYTIRSSFYIDKSLKDIQLSLFITSVTYPFVVFLNGKQIYKKGKYKDSYNSLIFNSSNIFLSKDILKYENIKNEIAVQIFPKFEPAPFPKIILSTYEKNDKSVFIRDLLNIHFIQGFGIILFIIFLYFLSLFILNKFKDFKYLFFGVSSLIFIFCYFNVIFYNESVNEILNEKISRSAFPIIVMFLTLFIIEYTKFRVFLKKFKYLIYISVFLPGSIFSFLTFIQKNKQSIFRIFNISTSTIIPIYLLFSFVLISVYSFYTIFKKKKMISLIIFIGFTGLFAGAIHDIVMFSFLKIAPVIWFAPYGYAVIIISIFFTLSFEQARLFVLSRNYAKELEQTVQKRTTNLLKAKNDLEKTNYKLTKLDSLKNDFIANITHDFRSPLTAIYNISDLVLKFGIEDKKDNLDNYEIIYQASLRLKKSIDRLLELAKMDAQGVTLKVKKVNVNLLIDDVLDFYSSSTLGSNINIQKKYNNIDVKDFYTDKEKLEEIIHNILSNAIKFIDPNDGIINVEIVNLKKVFRIIISDNGIGIPKNKLDVIFDRFEQASKGRNSIYGGTGIGLAYAKQLAEYIKGKIWAESDGLGTGSKFFIELKKGDKVFSKKDYYDGKIIQKKYDDIKSILQSDIKKKLEKEKITVYFTDLNKDNEYDFKKGKILVIDDDKNIRDIIMKYLVNAGYKNFIEGSDGVQGLDAVYDYSPDLIICDFNMPNMKGDVFHDQLLSNPNYKNIPFIFLSAVADIDLIIERRMKGACDYLKKPIEEKMFLLTIEQNLKKYFEYLKNIKLATVDELTGLYNKSEIINQLKNKLSIREYRNLSLIFIDIDDFKKINDTYGHQAGDKVLESVGKLLKKSIRAYDISGRYGGEEFLVILPDTNINQAESAALIIRNKMKNIEIEFDKKKINFTASFGISSLIDNKDYICKELKINDLEKIYHVIDPKNADWDKIDNYKSGIVDILLKMADKALYKAKSIICSKCGYKSLKSEDFKNKKCPECGSHNYQAGKDKIILYDG